MATLCVIGACVLVGLGTGRTGAIKSWITMQRFFPPRRRWVHIMPGQYVCVWVANCLYVRMWREGRQWEEFISILVVTHLCSKTRGTKRRHIGEPCFAKSSLTFAAAQCAGGQNQPKSHCLGHTRANHEKLFTCLSVSLSAAHHPYAAATPGVFPTA